MDIYTYLVAFITFIMTYIVYERMDKKLKNLPPGPVRLPIIGTMYAFSPSLASSRIIRKSLGDVALLSGGRFRAIILSSLEAIKEASVTKARDCSDRGGGASLIFKLMNPERKGILQSNFHERLQYNRSASLTILRNLGVGRSAMEEKMLEEIEVLVRTIGTQKQVGDGFDPSSILTSSVANVILHVVLSKRYHHDDPEFRKLVEYITDLTAAGRHMGLIENFKLLRFIPPFKTTLDKGLASSEGLCDYMWRQVKDRVEKEQPGNQTDFVDAWIEKVADDNNNPRHFDKENFLFILRDFLVAGTETTTTSLKWTIALLVNHPDIQAKVHEEIDRVIGKQKAIRLNDRTSLPYLEAIVQEVQRFKTILPLGLAHYNHVDTKIQNYTIPANSYIMFNLHGVHMNEDIFGDPDVFRPDRFIDPNDGQFIKHPNVIPFAIGKRSCLGELLARQELFIFTAALLQNFKFSAPVGVDKIDDQGVLGFTHSPKRFNIRAFRR